MIVGKLEDLHSQVPDSPHMKKGLSYLIEVSSQKLADGRYEIDGDSIYALVQSYDTLTASDQSKYEAHRKYIDIQYISEGIEVMGWAPLEAMEITKEYVPDKDVVNGTVLLKLATLIKVSAGQAAIFFPSDAHAPKLAADQPSPVKKIVVKVAV